MIFVDFIVFCSVGVGCEMEILDFCIAFFEVAMVFFVWVFLRFSIKGTILNFWCGMCDFCCVIWGFGGFCVFCG